MHDRTLLNIVIFPLTVHYLFCPILDTVTALVRALHIHDCAMCREGSDEKRDTNVAECDVKDYSRCSGKNITVPELYGWKQQRHEYQIPIPGELPRTRT